MNILIWLMWYHMNLMFGLNLLFGHDSLIQSCWKSLLGLFGVTGLGCQPNLGLYIFAGRVTFSNNHFCLFSNIGTVVIIEILADVYAAKIKMATSTLTSKHWFLTLYLSTCLGSIGCSAQIPVTKECYSCSTVLEFEIAYCLVVAILYYLF